MSRELDELVELGNGLSLWLAVWRGPRHEVWEKVREGRALVREAIAWLSDQEGSE